MKLSRLRTDRTGSLAAILGLLLLFAVPVSGQDHTVRKGDTLFSVARLYGVTVSDLRQWNGLAGNAIRIGQRLKVTAPAAVLPGRKMVLAAYRVRKGETLWRIAYTRGITLSRLMEINAIRDVGSVKSGQLIRIEVPATGPARTPPPAVRPPSFYLDKPVDGPAEQTQDRKGARIYCPEGSRVRAVRDGTVEYTGTLVGYKNVVILNHGGNIYTVYAGLADIFVDQGSRVTRSQDLGAVEKLSHYDRAFCYFELIMNGDHADAVRYLK